MGRSNGSSKLLPYSGFVRKGYSRTAWREAFERTTDGRPYSGKFRTAVGETCGLPLRKVTSIQYGVKYALSVDDTFVRRHLSPKGEAITSVT